MSRKCPLPKTFLIKGNNLSEDSSFYADCQKSVRVRNLNNEMVLRVA